MISCGEPSGDLYAGALATALRAADPSVEVTGFGSDRLRAAGAALTGDFKGLSVTGLLEVARVLPRTYAAYRRLVAEAAARRPDVFVAVDFPDFNFRLAAAVRRLGVPVVYYISPQLWAWRRGRMKTMRRIADRVLVIFPFEAPIYEAAGVPVEWVGHPLLDVTPPPAPRDPFLRGLGLDPTRPVVALLPGSRKNESARSCRTWRARRCSSAGASRTSSSSSRARRTCPRGSSSRSACWPTRRAAPPLSWTATPTTCWPPPTWRWSRRGPSPCRPRSTSARWWWSTGSRR
jgi:lipid A disaccharide synthetase